MGDNYSPGFEGGVVVYCTILYSPSHEEEVGSIRSYTKNSHGHTINLSTLKAQDSHEEETAAYWTYQVSDELRSIVLHTDSRAIQVHLLRQLGSADCLQ